MLTMRSENKPRSTKKVEKQQTNDGHNRKKYFSLFVKRLVKNEKSYNERTRTGATGRKQDGHENSAKIFPVLNFRSV